MEVKQMSYEELKDEIEEYIQSLKDIPTGNDESERIRELLTAVEIELSERKEQYYKQIINDITEPDTMNKNKANYTSYLSFLSDAEMGNHGYVEVLYERFEEEELEKLWNDSHCFEK